MKQELFRELSWTDEACKDKSTEHYIQVIKDEIERFNEMYGTKFEPHKTAIEYLEKQA
jgi:hypothetical protein